MLNKENPTMFERRQSHIPVYGNFSFLNMECHDLAHLAFSLFMKIFDKLSRQHRK